MESKEKITIFINKCLLDGVNLNEKKEVEQYLKKLFRRLNEYYNVTINGYYDVDLYIDNFYGIVLDLKKDDISYYDYYENYVDMRIVYHQTDFLYEVDNFWNSDKVDNYIYDGKIYAKVINKTGVNEMLELIEHSTIAYKDTGSILTKAKICVNS